MPRTGSLSDAHVDELTNVQQQIAVARERLEALLKKEEELKQHIRRVCTP